MATRQNSTNGKPKSPRIQVVLPENLCAKLALLAEEESRTVSNMAKVLIQEGVNNYLVKEGKAPSSHSNTPLQLIMLVDHIGVQEEQLEFLGI